MKRYALHHQLGLSLVEMMISITIGLVILSAMITLFVSQNKTRSDLDKTNRMIDNGQYAIGLLGDNLKLAGYYGSFDPGTIALPGSMPDPCSTSVSDISAALPLHIQGYDAATTTSVISSPPSCVPSTRKPGSDILVVRRVDTAASVAVGSVVAGTIYVQGSLCPLDTATSYIVGSASASFTLRQKGCTSTSTAYANVRPMMVDIYFVDQNNEGTDGIPTLKRMEVRFAGVAPVTVALVEGVEFMQLEYGIDTDADGAADSYSTCSGCTVTDWSNVMSVRASLLARTQDTVAGYTDGKVYTLPGWTDSYTPASSDRYKRHVYSQLARVVNPSSRREVP